MLKGSWIRVNQRDRKKLKDLLKFHGNFEKLASLIGISERTLKNWMKKDSDASFRVGARDKIKRLHTAMKREDGKMEMVGPLVNQARETVFAEVQVEDKMAELRELHEALGIVLKHLDR